MVNIFDEPVKNQIVDNPVLQNYMHVIQPNYKIHIGIKDDKVVSFHFGELIDYDNTLSNQEVSEKVEKYLRDALEQHIKNTKLIIFNERK